MTAPLPPLPQQEGWTDSQDIQCLGGFRFTPLPFLVLTQSAKVCAGPWPPPPPLGKPMINVTDICRALTPFHILFYFWPIFLLDPHKHLEKKSLTSGLPMRRWRPREMKRITEAQPRMKTQVFCLWFSPTAPQGGGRFSPGVNHTPPSQLPTPWPLTSRSVFQTSQKPEIGILKIRCLLGNVL